MWGRDPFPLRYESGGGRRRTAPRLASRERPTPNTWLAHPLMRLAQAETVDEQFDAIAQAGPCGQAMTSSTRSRLPRPGWRRHARPQRRARPLVRMRRAPLPPSLCTPRLLAHGSVSVKGSSFTTPWACLAVVEIGLAGAFHISDPRCTTDFCFRHAFLSTHAASRSAQVTQPPRSGGSGTTRCRARRR